MRRVVWSSSTIGIMCLPRRHCCCVPNPLLLSGLTVWRLNCRLLPCMLTSTHCLLCKSVIWSFTVHVCSGLLENMWDMGSALPCSIFVSNTYRRVIAAELWYFYILYRIFLLIRVLRGFYRIISESKAWL